ncbi:bifunctional [glutamate--ammonia ligase]-adenylyl-L-tyrosine phosphorylase/[glutamate--ammonia-ligase] adenylyltransferase [Qipengyuania sp.]|uniref:bifunctional [glutamate--ammonia ligase]-adenylyl-L-tyrosine phosphorylase/[glutamate--ammonia-ligase] adenylyltransferase n=1 Tax=Qipengyuania sp. TaxID=2004515 RepID=UPI00373698FB
MAPDWTEAIARARAHAPFLARGLDRFPDLAELLARGDGEQALLAAKQAGQAAPAPDRALRLEKNALALVLAIGDLAGAFGLDKVMRELSTFADRALHRAIESAIQRRVPGAPTQGFVALALGKHGAGELNYSSDIDPILLYDPDRLPRRERDEPGEAAQRYAREIVRLLSEVTQDGYVFRVDLRLRPASEVSPLALPIGGAISHYESSALAWERAAFIRARSAAGDIAAGEAFLDHIRPFVWRRSLDFGAIDDVRRLTHRIRQKDAGPDEPEAGYDLKLGRGGIREIEFFAQTHQLIHGGRDRRLRSRRTRRALAALADTGRIEPATAQVLAASYAGLRTIEHRLQMVDDRQTHVLPAGTALDNVARLHGLADGEGLLAEVRRLVAPVADSYDALLDQDRISVARSAPHLRPAPARQAPPLAPDLAQRIERWTDGRYQPLRSSAAIAAFESVREDLEEALARSPDPARAVTRWESLLSRMSSAINLFRLLEARPGLFQLLVDILTLSAPLADELARRPKLLDTLIDRGARDLPPEVEDIVAQMQQGERGDTYEHRLDRIRILTGEARFALGVQLIDGAHDPLAIGRGLSRLAEAAIAAAQHAAQHEFSLRHGAIAGGELIVLGLGRLGGGMLTHASDLDLIYLFTGAPESESDGERALGATMYYNRLAQRISAALSVPTAEGALYDVDTRLRPQGAQGPLAVSLAAFERYQREDAWTWEHMALTRARTITGSPDRREAIERAIRRILARGREEDPLRQEILEMRARMAAHKPARGPLDVKLLRGGLVDLEFLVHALQLQGGIGLVPDLGGALGLLIEAGKLPAELAGVHDLMTRLLISTRLLAPETIVPGAYSTDLLARICGIDTAGDLLPTLAGTRAQVAAAWEQVFGERLETE